MKAKFLKIAKCKTEKEFYKKYPTEAAFFKAHPEAKASIKKAQIGAYIGGNTTSNPKMIDYQEYYDEAEKPITGSTQKEREEAAYKQQMLQASKTSSSGITDLLGMIKGGMGDDGSEPGDFLPEGMMGGAGGGEGMMGGLGMRRGGNVPKAQVGTSAPAIQANANAIQISNQPTWGIQGLPSGVLSGQPAAGVLTGGTQVSQNVDPFTQTNTSTVQGPGFLNTALKAVPVIGDLVGGIKGLKNDKEAAARARQQKKVSGLNLIASTTRPEKTRKLYNTPWDNPIQQNQMFPSYGVGTNVLGSARDGVMLQGGGEIQNTYAPGYLYDDLGYEPLNDSNVKQYYRGGDIPKAQTGLGNYASTLGGGGSGFSGAGGGGATPWGAIGGIGSSMANSAAGGGNASGQIGGAIGGGLGAIFGPAGMAIGQTLGTAVGNAVSPYAKRTKEDLVATERNVKNTAYNNMASDFTSPYQAHARNGRNIANYEEGGYMNPEYNPQLITMFGGLDEQEVYDYAHDGMQSLRAGGHIRGEYQPISNRGMQTYDDGGEVKTSALNGEIQTTWGGGIKTLSHNPYMPASGKTFKFVGNSHDTSDGNGNTGIGVKYGKGGHDSYTDYAEYGTQEADADVEVEMEPAAELIDPKTGEKNLTIWGDLSTDKFQNILGKEAKNSKFKTLVDKHWTKQEIKGNKLVKQASEIANKKGATPIDFTTAQALEFAGKSILKNIAEKKMDAAYLQNAINETAEENGLVASDLARGKVKFDKEDLQEYAEYGKTIKKAKDGVTTDDDGKKISKAERDRRLKSGKWKVDPSNPNRIYSVESKSGTSDEKKSATALGYIPKGQSVDPTTGLSIKITSKQFEEFKEKNKWYDWSKFDPKDPNAVNDFANKFNEKAKELGSDARILPDKDGKVTIIGEQFISGSLDASKKETPGSSESEYLEVEDEDKVYPVEPQKRNTLLDIAGQVLPFFRPTDQEPFDYEQLYPEMYALGSNQLEPVQAQGYQPQLATPYDISLQDQLNANQADYNSMQRLYANNPFALSQFAAQKYAANEKVLADQFRANQAMQMGTYDQNRQVLNDAKLKNLDIYDRQYTRQAQAKSNTKAVTQAALNSIADKYAKHKLENRTLGVYENLYNYRYDPSGRAINMNAPWQANLPNMYDKGNRTANMRAVYDKQGNFLRYEPIEETKTVTDETLTAAGKTPGIGDKKNGGKVKAKNGSIVSAYKNL